MAKILKIFLVIRLLMHRLRLPHNHLTAFVQQDNDITLSRVCCYSIKHRRPKLKILGYLFCFLFLFLFLFLFFRHLYECGHQGNVTWHPAFSIWKCCVTTVWILGSHGNATVLLEIIFLIFSEKNLLTLLLCCIICCLLAPQVASYADALWARHAIFVPRGGGILRDEPKERLRRRLLLRPCSLEYFSWNIAGFQCHAI